MDIDIQHAAALGFPKPQYTAVERERRWLCRELPHELVERVEAITDLYIAGTRMRLREARPADGSPALLRLSRKADINSCTRLITSIYLPEEEFRVLANALPGARIAKLRHRLRGTRGIALAIDEFQGALAGLLLVEAEFETADALAAFEAPDFCAREVTDEPRFTGSVLAHQGLPVEFRR